MPKATKRIHVAIEKSGDSHCAYAMNVEGIYGQGNNIHEVKASIRKSITLFEQYNLGYAQGISITQVIFHYDTWSFIKYFVKPLLQITWERLVGLPQKQL